MEDGDDDTSLTADGQKGKEDQESAENNILVPSDDCEEVCSDEKYLMSSTSQSDDNLFVAKSQFHDKEYTSDQESDNKTCNSDHSLVDSSSEFVDQSDEFRNVAREPSPAFVAGVQPTRPEEDSHGIIPQEESSEPCEIQNECQVSAEEEKELPSMEETENIHSSVGEAQNTLSSVEQTENVLSSVGEKESEFPAREETENMHSAVEEEEETMEEEKEEEQELQAPATSDELISKQSEDNLQESDGTFKKSDYSDEMCEDKCVTEENATIKENSETLNNSDAVSVLNMCSDLHPENHDNESSIEEERDSGENVDKLDHENEDFEENCNVRSESEKLFKREGAQSVDYHDENTSPYGKDSVTEDSVTDSTDHMDKCDEIALKEEEENKMDAVESSIPLEVSGARETLIDELKDKSSPIHIMEDDHSEKDEQLDQNDKNEISFSLESFEPKGEESVLKSSPHSVESDSDIEFTQNEDRDKIVELRDELSDKEKGEENMSPVSEERDMSGESCATSAQILTETEKSEQIIELKEEERATDEIMEQDSDTTDVEMSVQSPELDNTRCEIPSSPIPQDQEPSRNTPEATEENTVSECASDPKNVEKDMDVSVKINGEVELTKDRLLDDKDSSTPAKEKVSLKRKLHNSPTQGISCEISPPESVKGNIHFKGFKKRYISQVSEVTSKDTPDVPPSIPEELRVLNKKSGKKLILETPQVLVSHQPLLDGAQANTPLTEYAQYLGLQPTVKFKCYNCGESGFPSMLKLQEHQSICLKNVRIHTYTKPPPSPIVEPAPSTNFRITRKVYLCSACGTYYENWNLFLHMREVHKRQICLFCLSMFSQADKLAQHLSGKHGIADNSYGSPEQFLHEFKGSFFVMCCTCEQMFSERDNFFDHLCKDTSVINTDQACTLCGLKGAHFPTCRRAFTDSSSLSSPSQSNQQSAVINSNTDTSQNSQLSSQEKPGTTSKYSLLNDKPTSGRKSQYKLSEQNIERSNKNHHSGDIDDDYDISDAASYCHVNIHEPDKQKQETPEEKIDDEDPVIDDLNVDVEKINNEEQSNEENQNFVAEGSVSNENVNNLENNAISKEDFGSENESHLHLEDPLPQATETAQEEEDEEGEEETREMEVDDKLVLQPPLSPNVDEAKQTETSRETQLMNQSKSSNNGDSESDTSVSVADSHDSEGSSSSSEASSDENEQEEKEPMKEDPKSEDSDVEKSDSDKMSIVVDETKSDDDLDKQVNVNDLNNSNITENETNELNEHKNGSLTNSDVKVGDKLTNNMDVGEDQQDNIQIAGDDVPLLELTLEETLDVLSIQTVVKECVKISCSSCVYCNHAKKIAVNGKQLVLHLLAEHRFEPVVCSDSGELTPIFGFVDNLKAKLSELQDMYFNTDSYDSADKNFTRPYDRTYECFHCHFITTLHKELYVHNRKMHQKTILLCIMCKSNFYSYSELLCHLCPGIYVPDSNILFRCCLCIVDGLPSAFRLMVHLRKRHHACDVCLETTGDQQKLSNHVWKHKLHHLCYRCGIAYRNKPDITKHLFWKHGTESVLCKKCLQKKWPHVYHFCIPPTAFLCEECNASFSRAVALKVHKRLHAGDISYQCDECEEKFISKKLLRRHKEKHRQPIVEKEDYKSNENVADDEMQELEPDEVKSRTPVLENENEDVDKDVKEDDSVAEKSNVTSDSGQDPETVQEIPRNSEEIESNKPNEIKDNKKSKVVDVYDLPPLNLSSESDDSDEEQITKQPTKDLEPEDPPKLAVNENAGEIIKSHEGEQPTEEEVQPVQIVDGVWDNFKNYKANLEKREILQAQASESLKATSSTPISDNVENHAIMDIVMADHDYCVLPEKPIEDSQLVEDGSQIQPSQNTDVSEKESTENLDEKSSGFGADHNYCFNTSPHSEDKNETPPSLPQIPSNLNVQSPSLPLPHPSLPLSPAQPPPPPPLPPTPPNPLTSSPKKKQKSPKKKQKQSGSSSSSDSSSSDSSSCTCGTNCSCTSNSSSSSSGSSSTSSDSDSSSSEGRRRQAARRERRRERAKRKLETGSKAGTPPPAPGLSTPGVERGGGSGGRTVEVTPTPLHIDSSGAGSLQVDDTPATAAPESEDNDFFIRESDLDTTETETDEDFYDKYPQKQANKLLAEKRNQLLLLAAVAPVNNGTIAQPSPPPLTETQEPIQKKKVKTKRHKRAQHNSSEKKESKLKLNIPAAYYNNPSFSVGNVGHSVTPLPNSHNPTSSHVPRLPLDTYSPANPEASSTPTAYHSTGSGSENESKRLSKRKRIPKKFYGDSSDEEAEHSSQQPLKWRKVIPTTNNTPVAQPTVPSGFTYRAVSVPPPEPVPVQNFPQPEKSDEEDGDESDSGHEAKRSSSESSNSDSDNEQTEADSDVETVPTVTNVISSVSGNTAQQKNENLYCYCQCPYDEVSEMIACDGKDCSIEWFHFECVGIMVPPKGKWFCPDCRKKTAARSEYLLHA